MPSSSKASVDQFEVPLTQVKRKDGGVEQIVSLSGLFHDSEDEEDGVGGGQFDQSYEEQVLTIAEMQIIIRQYSWHMANANKVWPGTFALAEFMDSHLEAFKGSRVLELGAATGALSIYLSSKGVDMVTSDIDDGGEVEENIRYNFQKNSLVSVPHAVHTWGEKWPDLTVPSSSISFIIASDILLYVK